MSDENGLAELDNELLPINVDVAGAGDAMGSEGRLTEPARRDLVSVAVDDTGGAVEVAAEEVAEQERVAVRRLRHGDRLPNPAAA